MFVIVPQPMKAFFEFKLRCEPKEVDEIGDTRHTLRFRDRLKIQVAVVLRYWSSIDGMGLGSY